MAGDSATIIRPCYSIFIQVLMLKYWTVFKNSCYFYYFAKYRKCEVLHKLAKKQMRVTLFCWNETGWLLCHSKNLDFDLMMLRFVFLATELYTWAPCFFSCSFNIPCSSCSKTHFAISPLENQTKHLRLD